MVGRGKFSNSSCGRRTKEILGGSNVRLSKWVRSFSDKGMRFYIRFYNQYSQTDLWSEFCCFITWPSCAKHQPQVSLVRVNDRDNGSYYLCVTVQQPDGFVGDLEQHFLRPYFVLWLQEGELLDGIVHRDNGVSLVHDERGEMLQENEILKKLH